MSNFNERRPAESTEKIPPETAEAVRKTLDDLKNEGYEFEYKETPDEFMLKSAHPPKENHFNKMDPFPLERNGETGYVALKDAIKARVINPDGSLYDTIHSEDFKNERSRREKRRKSSIIEKAGVGEFIRLRGIKPEDFGLIEKLAGFSTELITMELHNVFNLSHERSGRDLEFRITQINGLPAKDFRFFGGADKIKELCGAALAFFNKYGWEASYHLVRMLENLE
jgi:hypothetical protein